MNYKNWNENITNYPLTEGYEIERARSEEFAIYCITYRNVDITFRKSWDMHYEEMKNKNNCFWIKKDNQIIGGVRMEPNYIDSLFLIPPYSDKFKVLQILKKILVHWSDKGKDIYSYSVIPSEIEDYKRIGFFTTLSLRCMIRPTEKFNLDWDGNYKIFCPVKEKDLELAKLFYEAYSDGIDDYAKQSVEQHIIDVRSFLNEKFQEYNETIKNASAVVYDKDTNELVGVCFITLWEGWPYLSNIAVKPTHRGKGLAEKMIKRALNILKDEYPVIRLDVLVGNSSESLYYKLGFLPGPEIAHLFLPACYR